jgi:hypothetical protein
MKCEPETAYIGYISGNNTNGQVNAKHTLSSLAVRAFEQISKQASKLHRATARVMYPMSSAAPRWWLNRRFLIVALRVSKQESDHLFNFDGESKPEVLQSQAM